MLFLRTPLRVSFFGGGSDLPSYFEQGAPGCVISTTIDKYIHLVINDIPQKHYRAVYSTDETVEDLDEMKHDIIRETLKLFKERPGIEIGSFADIYVKGTGLGSSSSFAVGLIRGLYPHLSPTEVAMIASHIEINLLGQKIGYQDQFACAYGGFNKITFAGNHQKQQIKVEPLHAVVSSSNIRKLEDSMLLVYLGSERKSSAAKLLAAQSVAMLDRAKKNVVDQMVALTHEVYEDLLCNDNVNNFGEMLDISWKLKKTITPTISTDDIDHVYDYLVSEAKIQGGKLLGAGGSGYLLVCFKPEDRLRVKMIVEEDLQLEHFGFHFTHSGPEILFDSSK